MGRLSFMSVAGSLAWGVLRQHPGCLPSTPDRGRDSPQGRSQVGSSIALTVYGGSPGGASFWLFTT